MENYPPGVLFQAYLFERDYQNGVAISKRYSALISSPEYLAAGSRDKQCSKEPSKQKSNQDGKKLSQKSKKQSSKHNDKFN